MISANVQKTVFKVSDFISWQRSKSLLLSPNFQRRPVWPKTAKSHLIDSIVRGIPVPIIFLRSRRIDGRLESTREVVDGQQRLRTLIGFIDPGLLPDFRADRDDFTIRRTHNKPLAGLSFKELPEDARATILDYEFSVHVLPADTDDREILQIFARMNSTGYKLNHQELRNAAWFGDFKSTCYELAYEQLPRWRSWAVFSETDIARMIEVEETSDMIAFMLRGLHGSSQSLLSRLYKDNDEDFPDRGEVVSRFRAVMDRIDQHFAQELPTLVFSRRALFNTLFVFVYKAMFGGNASVTKKNKPQPLRQDAISAVREFSRRVQADDVPERLRKALRGATSDLASRRARLEYLVSVG